MYSFKSARSELFKIQILQITNEMDYSSQEDIQKSVSDQRIEMEAANHLSKVVLLFVQFKILRNSNHI